MQYNLHDFKAGDILTAEQLNRIEAALQIVMSTALPCKIILIKEEHGKLKIKVKGLVPGNTYCLQFYKKSRRFGYEMMYNTQTNASNSGYVPQLAGKEHHRTDEEMFFFSDSIPDWMPSGILTTRYDLDFVTQDDGTATIDIDLSTWILDFLKPWDSTSFDNKDQFHYVFNDGPGTICALIGASPKKDCCIRFKIGVLQLLPTGEHDLIGLSDDTLILSGVPRYLEAEDLQVTSSQIIVADDYDKGIRASNLAVRIS